jgi:hypothetical protein
MISLVVLVVVLALGYAAFRRSGEVSGSRIEMAYRLVSPLPVLLALVLPGPIAMLVGPSAGDLGGWLTRAGLWLSVAMLPAGLVVLWTSRRRGPLVAAMFLALLPALMVGLVALLFRWGSR